MKKKAFLKYLLFALLAFGSFIGYLHFFPNDFFLSKREFTKKISQFEYLHTFFRFCLYNKKLLNPKIAELIENPEKFFILPSTHIIKSNEKRTVALIEIDQKKFILKRYNYKNFFDWITKCPFRSSKAYRAWYYMHHLQKKGVHTATPVAIIEKRIGPFWLNTYLLTEYIEGLTLDQALNYFDTKKLQLLNENIYQVLKIFYANKWLHRDFVTRNIIIDKDQISIIDLDEMHSYLFKNKIFHSKFHQKHSLKFVKSSLSDSISESSFLMVDNFPKGYNATF